MTTELITGKLGAPHVGSEDVGAFNAYTLGRGVIVLNGCTCTLTNANTARIADGDIVFDGRHFRVLDFEDVALRSGTPGMLRDDIIAIHYEKTADGIESATLTAIAGTSYETGTPAPDVSYIKASVLDGAMSADYPLYSLHYDGITVSTPKPLYEDWTPLIEAIAKIKSDKADKVHTHAASNITSGVFPIERGGTGGANIRTAANSLQVLSLSRSIGIASGGNLNSIVDPGTYCSGSQAITETLSNVPDGVTYGFRLNVYDIMGIAADSNYILQELVYYPTGKHFYRFRNSQNVWSAWRSNMMSTDGIGVAQGGTGATTRAGAMDNLTKLGSGSNPIANNAADTLANWRNLAFGVTWFTENRLEGQPNPTGSLINMPVPGMSVVNQLWHSGTNGSWYHRGIDASGILPWHQFLDNANTKARVIARGESNNWYYQIYSDNFCHAVYLYTTTRTCIKPWGNGYFNTSKLGGADYPTALSWKAAPRVETIISTTDGRMFATHCNDGTTKKAPTAYACSFAEYTTAQSCRLVQIAEGWVN